ncbi:MAG: hypothetical protein JNK65_04855, partial [Deltaproteobacteria bacterium]|nr:hypothetical protein [Deltaproteobacteria bacterium]
IDSTLGGLSSGGAGLPTASDDSNANSAAPTAQPTAGIIPHCTTKHYALIRVKLESSQKNDNQARIKNTAEVLEGGSLEDNSNDPFPNNKPKVEVKKIYSIEDSSTETFETNSKGELLLAYEPKRKDPHAQCGEYPQFELKASWQRVYGFSYQSAKIQWDGSEGTAGELHPTEVILVLINPLSNVVDEPTEAVKSY